MGKNVQYCLFIGTILDNVLLNNNSYTVLMRRFEPEEAAVIIRKMPFSKSWQNVFVTNVKKILNTETHELEDRALDDFVYLPAPSIIRHFSNDKDFLRFRIDNKTSKDWNYKFINDPTENTNRRLAIMYFEKILKALKIKFLIDDSYTVYLMHEELLKLSDSDIPALKEFVNSLYIPKTLARKKGSSETWGN